MKLCYIFLLIFRAQAGNVNVEGEISIMLNSMESNERYVNDENIGLEAKINLNDPSIFEPVKHRVEVPERLILNISDPIIDQVVGNKRNPQLEVPNNTKFMNNIKDEYTELSKKEHVNNLGTLEPIKRTEKRIKNSVPIETHVEDGASGFEVETLSISQISNKHFENEKSSLETKSSSDVVRILRPNLKNYDTEESGVDAKDGFDVSSSLEATEKSALKQVNDPTKEMDVYDLSTLHKVKNKTSVFETEDFDNPIKNNQKNNQGSNFEDTDNKTTLPSDYSHNIRGNKNDNVTVAPIVECQYLMPEEEQVQALLGIMMNELTKMFVRAQELINSNARRKGGKRFSVVTKKQRDFFEEIYRNMSQEYLKMYNISAVRVDGGKEKDPCKNQEEMKKLWRDLLDNSLKTFSGAALKCINENLKTRGEAEDSKISLKMRQYLYKEMGKIKRRQLELLCDKFQLCYDELFRTNDETTTEDMVQQFF